MYNRTVPDRPDTSTWPESLDALTAAPDHHTLILENDHVRVLETRIQPGESVPVHTHRWPAVTHVLSSSDFVRRSDTGEILLDTRSLAKNEPSIATWLEPLGPHSLENVGTATIHVLHVEIKD